MSEPDNFLMRWSRRKQEAERERLEPAPPTEAKREDETEIPAGGSAVQTPEAEFDLSTLPPIESITAGTDIRAFLQKGVPAALTRAALRRAWTSDPAIRDFIEIAENQWDFATGSDIPGFGPLEASEDVRQMVMSMFKGPSESTVEAALQKAEKTEHRALESHEPELQTPADAPPDAPSPDESGDAKRKDKKIVAPQQTAHVSDDVLPTRRRHGGALPD
jgi:hypothetical protein